MMRDDALPDAAPALARAVAWLRGEHPRSVERLVRWCNDNSWSLDGDRLAAMSDQLAQDFGSIGVNFDRIALPPVRVFGDRGDWSEFETGPALLWHSDAGLATTSPKRVLLMIHYDTVYPADHAPVTCSINGERLIGPGTADAKGGIATIYSAVAAVMNFDLASNLAISILLNPDEEVGSPSSRGLLVEMAPMLDAALLFEPTLPDGALVRARKGSGNFSYRVHGRAAHAGRDATAGRNAVVHAGRLITALDGLQATGVMVNVGKVSGGGPLNRVPDLANVQLNVRVESAEALSSMEERLHSLAAQFSGDGFRVELLGGFHAPPKVPDEAFAALERLVERSAARLSRTLGWRDTGGACDGNKLTALGVANVDSLGVTGDGLHSDREFCDLGSLVPAASLLLSILMSMSEAAAAG